MESSCSLPGQDPEMILDCEQDNLAAAVVDLDSSGSESDPDDDTFSSETLRPKRKRAPHGPKNLDTIFVDLLSRYGIPLLDRSQTPRLKTEKLFAMERIRKELLERLGVELSDKQITKKIYNIKTRARSKNYLNQTGIKKMRLNAAETKIVQLISNLPLTDTMGMGSPNEKVVPTVDPATNEDSSSGESKAQMSQQSLRSKINLPKQSSLLSLQETILHEQFNLLRTRDMLLRQQHEVTMQQQQERHAEEMKLLKCKHEIAQLKLLMMKSNTEFVEIKKENGAFSSL